jgi:hypothetical protein
VRRLLRGRGPAGRPERAEDLAVAPGERLLAIARGPDSAEGGAAVVGGTADAVYVASHAGADVVRIAWEAVEAADWNADERRLRISEVGAWGAARPEHVVTLADPDRLLQLVRERVTASVVLQRHVPVAGRRGVRVIARRAPRGGGRLRWVFEYDEGVDPDDPHVRRVADAALAAAREETGDVG